MNLKPLWHKNILWVLPWPVIALVLYAVVLNAEITADSQSNRFLQQEIRKLDTQIKEIKNLQTARRNFLERASIIQELESSGTDHVALLNFVSSLDASIFLQRLNYKDRQLTLEGKFSDKDSLIAMARGLTEIGYRASENAQAYRVRNGDGFLIQRRYSGDRE